MATLAPESRGAAMSIMNLGSGMSTFIGPAIAGVFLPLLGGLRCDLDLCSHGSHRRSHQLHVATSRCPGFAIGHAN